MFSPRLFLSVMVETQSELDSDELHFHPGGQGFWIARALHQLGEQPLLVTSLGGESGCVLRGLAPAWEVEMNVIEMASSSPVFLYDRRSGERRLIAHANAGKRNRHEVDDLYGRVLDQAIGAGVCVVTGTWPVDHDQPDFFRRLGADLASTEVTVVGDLHGEELEAFLAGGPLHTLKVSDSDLVNDGLLSGDAGFEERLAVVDQLVDAGAERVLLSSAERPTLARFGELRLMADPPLLQPADPRGAGDAMTAALAAAVLRDLAPEEACQLACAAGAANVTRRGLGNADARLIERLAGRVRVQRLTAARAIW
ncbi:MAG: PfkB family carbohydrate kinase [Planctomycetota bacterium]